MVSRACSGPGSSELQNVSFKATIRTRRTIRQPEILKMNVSLWIQLASRLHKRVDELVILLPTNSRLFQAQVQFIFEKLLIISPAVENYRESSVRVDPSAERRQDQLGNGYQNPSYALITDAENLFSIYNALAIRKYQALRVLQNAPVTTM